MADITGTARAVQSKSVQHQSVHTRSLDVQSHLAKSSQTGTCRLRAVPPRQADGFVHQPQRRLSYQPTHRTSINIVDEKSAARHYFAVPFPSNGSSGSMTLQYLERSEHNAGPALRICVLCGLCEYADHQSILSRPLHVIAQTPAFNRRTFHEHLICTPLHGSSTIKSRQELSVTFPCRPVSHPL